MQPKLNQRLQELRGDIISSTQKLIQIKSVKAAPQEGMPFGEGINKALDTALKLGESLGLKSVNVDGYAGHLEYGEGEEILGILCHLDVVPAGKGWTYPPYSGTIHENKIYGRGAIDDKGPAVAALYALKAVKDSGIKLNKRVRLILGTDEESGWQGLKYYLEREESPALAFSPDAMFPVINGEMGILLFKLKGNISPRQDSQFKILSIKGGNAPNMVPDYCEAQIATSNLDLLREKLEQFVQKTGFQLEMVAENKEATLKSYGRSAHGSLPQKGQNAISQLMLFLASLMNNGDFINFYAQTIALEYNGQSIGCQLQDELSGPLVFNVGMIEAGPEKAEITVNVRYPVTSNHKQVYTGLKKTIKAWQVELEEISHSRPLFVPETDPLVQKLMKVYQELTGDNSKAMVIGGGTYARAIKKAVAFGPLFPGQAELAHQKDEYIDLDDLILNAQIYAQAIAELAGV